MSASAQALMALGMPADLAKNAGDTLSLAQAGATTASATATVLAGTVNSVTTASSQTAFRLPAHNAGRTVEVYNTSATTALVYPPTGGTIDGGSTDASVSVAQNKGRIFRYLTTLTIVSILTA